MQVDVKNVMFLKNSINILNSFVDELNNIADNYFNNLTKFLEEANFELNLSITFLNTAKVVEAQKLAILTQAQAELAAALQAEAAALASGNPVAIAAATAKVAQASAKVTKATTEYNKARQNRINMERRVELVKKAKYLISRLLEESKNNFNINLSSIKFHQQTYNLRVQKGYINLIEYKFTDIIESSLNNVEFFFKSLGISDLEKDLLNNVRVQKIEGKLVAKRDYIFKPCQKDELNRTNKQRMEQGLAPLDKDGKPIELHHLKQKDNGIIIELTNEEHKKDSKTLHRYEKDSQINRVEFDKWKRKYWKNRAEEAEC